MTEKAGGPAPGRILITGAAGGVGTFLRAGLSVLGWEIRCLDLRLPDDPGDAEWVVADVADQPAVIAAMAGVDVVIHLAGIPVEDHFAAILHANIDGTQQVFEAAVRAGVPRVLYASTNHVVGYYERADFADRPLGVGERTRPDTFYAVSKAFGEALGSFYHDRYGLQVACVRIGALLPEPLTRRMLDTWFSPADAVRLFHALATVPDLGYEIVFGVSANPTAWADLEPARRLGYVNDRRMKSKKFYRIIMILPYAFPAFLSALVWAGLYNTDFGFINQVLLGGASIPWLTDPWLAKFAILFTNLWLGFPYMFLVCTGALQSLPEDVVEAGRMDGASVWQIFRHLKFPLLLVAVAPLLISSFAFNFNNFNLIYMMTNGGPQFADASINVGATDLLISMVYKVAFVGSSRDYGLASAFSIIIFILVALIAWVGFRQTKVLEELN